MARGRGAEVMRRAPINTYIPISQRRRPVRSGVVQVTKIMSGKATRASVHDAVRCALTSKLGWSDCTIALHGHGASHRVLSAMCVLYVPLPKNSGVCFEMMEHSGLLLRTPIPVGDVWDTGHEWDTSNRRIVA